MKGLPRSRSRGAPAINSIIKQAIRVSNLALEVDGASGVGFGAAVPADLPQGNIVLLGAVSYLTFTKVTATGVQDAFDGDYSIGSTPTADATLSSTDADIIPSTALGVATAGVSPRVRGVMATATAGTIFDNTDDSLELNLNLIIDDANINANDQAMRADGVIHLLYAVLGDD